MAAALSKDNCNIFLALDWTTVGAYKYSIDDAFSTLLTYDEAKEHCESLGAADGLLTWLYEPRDDITRADVITAIKKEVTDTDNKGLWINGVRQNPYTCADCNV